jgi:molybdopterin synthase catalytic subunit
MARLVRLTNDPIDPATAIAAVARAGAGGIDVFLGAVRDANEGRAVTLLEYEAYAPMAVAEMERIVSEIEATFDGVTCAVVHRVGSLHVGDLAVVCAASAPHRGEAFAACRKLIDEIKHRVPIWKREHGPAGAYWVGWVDARCGDGHGT